MCLHSFVSGFTDFICMTFSNVVMRYIAKFINNAVFRNVQQDAEEKLTFDIS